MSKSILVAEDRLFSLDFFRGLTMFLLIGESTGLFRWFLVPELKGTFLYFVGTQLHHPKWDGVSFWDAIHPFFVFIVGVAMPLSFSKRMQRGESSRDIFRHVIKRSLLLLLLGWGIVCINNGKIGILFLNVLCGLSFWYFIAYLVMRKPAWFQITFSLSLVLITELLYRFFPLEGFNQPFTPGHNFGAWIDLHTLQTNPGHWSYFNKVPSTAHIIWGVLAGQLLLSDKPANKKFRILLIYGLTGLVLGFGLSTFTPIIKRIATSSWVITTGGLALTVFALCYWLIDIKKFHKGVRFFAIVGMNPLFIFLFASVGGARFLRGIVNPFSTALFSWAGDWTLNVISSLIVLFLMWYICYWLYKRKIFIRI